MLLAGSLLAADSSPKGDVGNAAKNLAAKGNYSWKTTVETAGGGGGGRFRPGPTDGKADKDGTISLAMTRGDNTIEAVLNGTKGAIKTTDGWKSLSEATAGDGGDQPNPGRFLARMLQTYKAPAAEAEDLLSKAKEMKKSDDAFSAELTEEGVKQIFARGPRRPGADAPSPTNAKGSVKFWLNDGALSKYQYNLQGTMDFNGNDVNINRTTTVEIKDVGTTKITVPEEAKKKLS